MSYGAFKQVIAVNTYYVLNTPYLRSYRKSGDMPTMPRWSVIAMPTMPSDCYAVQTMPDHT